MGLDYVLDLEAKIEQQQALHLIASEIGVAPTDDTDIDTPILSIAVRKSADHRSIILDDFGFLPTITATFRLSPETDEDEETGRHQLMRAVMTLLHNTDGNAVLQFNYDYPLLERINGRLVLNGDWKEWTSYGLLDDVTLPHEVRHQVAA